MICWRPGRDPQDPRVIMIDPSHRRRGGWSAGSSYRDTWMHGWVYRPALQICEPQPNIRCREGWGEEARGSGGNLGLIAWMRAEAVCINRIMCETSSSILCWQTTQWAQYQHNKGWGSRVGTRVPAVYWDCGRGGAWSVQVGMSGLCNELNWLDTSC